MILMDRWGLDNKSKQQQFDKYYKRGINKIKGMAGKGD